MKIRRSVEDAPAEYGKWYSVIRCHGASMGEDASVRAGYGAF